MIDILLISGKQGSGKSTLTRSLIKEWEKTKGNRAFEFMFASHIKEMEKFIWGYLEHRGIKKPFPKDGHLLQLLGTEWGRALDPDLWVKLTQADITSTSERLGNVFENVLFVISDVRFPNEFDAFPHAKKVRLECDRAVRKYRCEAWRDTENHISETALDEYSRTERFDHYFDTAKLDADKITEILIKRLG